MKPASFEYVKPTTVDEALIALAEPDARALAGGQSLVPLMNLRLAEPSTLVDLNGLGELDRVVEDDGSIVVGALCRHRRLETDPVVQERVPLLAEAASHIGHGAIRARGTIGGSLAHGDPAGELCASLLALDGRVRVQSQTGIREIEADALFTGFFSTALKEGELLVEVIVPTRAPNEGSAFVEIAPRHGDFPVVGVAARIRLDDDRGLREARVAACGIAATPVRLDAACEPIIGASSLDDDRLRQVAAAVPDHFEPTVDLQATAEDRRELTQLLVVEALRRAWKRAGGVS